MASKKKARARTKAKKGKKKSVTRKAAAGKRVVRKPRPKKAAVRKKPASRTAKPKARPKTVAVAARRPAPAPQPAAPAAPPGEERIGVVTHYFTHLSVAIIRLETGMLREGDVLHIKGHTSDFTQRIESMEVDHVHVYEVRAGQSFGLRVKEHAREHDIVYKAKR